MPSFTNHEYADMLFVYGRAAVRKYCLRFPSRRVPNDQIFSAVFNSIAEYGSVPNNNKMIWKERNHLDSTYSNKWIS